MSNIINTVGFTDHRTLKQAATIIGAGMLMASVGGLIASTGLIMLKNSQEWVDATSIERMDALSKLYQKCADDIGN